MEKAFLHPPSKQEDRSMSSYILDSARHVGTFLFFSSFLVLGAILMSVSMAITAREQYALGGARGLRRWLAKEKKYMTQNTMITKTLQGIQLFLLLMFGLVFLIEGFDAALDYVVLATAIQAVIVMGPDDLSSQRPQQISWRKNRKYFIAVGVVLTGLVAFVIRSHSIWLDVFSGALIGGFILFALFARRINAINTENPLRHVKDALAWIAIGLATVPYLWVLMVFFCLWLKMGHVQH